MKVLLISANQLPAFPTGPAAVAGAARRAGHEVQIFETLFANDLKTELGELLERMQPDVVGISIRLVFGDLLDETAPLGTRHLDLRPRIHEIVDVVRCVSHAVIVLGGPGFNYYARDWLAYLGVDYGLRGEGEESFPLFLERLQSRGDLLSVPGCVGRATTATRSVPPAAVSDPNSTALPACDLLDLPQYEAHNITPAVLTKRGCAFHCSYCPYAGLEGSRYRLKSPQRVVQEIKQILNVSHKRRVQLCDNSFNAPVTHAADLCRAFITERLDFQWGTGDLKPIGVTDAFCHLLEDSGCYYASLAAESASESMLKNMRRGYGVRQVRQSLDALSRSKVPYGISLMFGAPGETPETVEESLRLVEDYEYPAGVWVTVGIYLWTDYQQVVAQGRAAGELDDRQLFEGAVYLSPMLKEDYLKELRTRLAVRPGWKVQFNQPPHRLPSGSAR